MNLTYDQLKGLWVQAGGPSQIAGIMAAIALAESGGTPTALNGTDNGGRQSSYGLWQISTGTHNPPSPNWSDPLTNAQLAVQKWKDQGLGAWGTWVTGAYIKFIQPADLGATIPAEPIPSPDPPALTTSGSTPVSNAACMPPEPDSTPVIGGVLTLTKTLNYWACIVAYDVQRLGFIVLGIVIVVLGFWVYAQDKDSPGSKQVDVVQKQAGKAAKTAVTAAATA